MDKKTKKATINPTNKNDNKCFQYAAALALNHKGIRKDSGQITKINPFLDKCNWEGINYPSEKDDQGKCERNKLTIALNVFFAKK